MSESRNTHLRFIRSKDPDKLTKLVGLLDYRVQIYDIVLGPDGKWYLWLVYGDNDKPDITNKDLD
jgi:hypothetical protein